MVPAVVQQAVADPLWFRGRVASARASAAADPLWFRARVASAQASAMVSA